MSDEKIIFSKKDQRKITNFIGQELLYDYISNNLDIERTSAVEEFVKASREAQADVQKINNALSYLEHLSETMVSESLLNEGRQPSSYFDLLLKRMRVDEWPKTAKMGIELLVISIGVVALILVIPWHKVMEFNFSKNKEIVLLEIEKSKNQSLTEISATEAQNSETVFPDEGAKPQEEKLKPEPTPLPPKKEEAHVAATPTEQKSTTKQEKKQGFLYRGEISVTNLKATTAKFVDYITELGGRKAGEVPIGWAKGNSTYFHFTMPEAKYATLQEFMRGYGQIKIQKENHDRIMPDGIVRIIITVYEKK